MIVDDEAPARSELKFLLEQTGKISSITEASSVRSAIEMLMESRVDVVFLDISMPGASGLQLAEALHKLKNPPAIVFVTAYSDHAVEAFDVDAVDYLLKPVEEARLDQAIEKVLTRVKPQTESKVSIERIPVEKGGRKVLIPVDQIRYIMAKDDYSCIFTDDDRFLSTTSRVLPRASSLYCEPCVRRRRRDGALGCHPAGHCGYGGARAGFSSSCGAA